MLFRRKNYFIDSNAEFIMYMTYAAENLKTITAFAKR